MQTLTLQLVLSTLGETPKDKSKTNRGGMIPDIDELETEPKPVKAIATVSPTTTPPAAPKANDVRGGDTFTRAQTIQIKAKDLKPEVKAEAQRIISTFESFIDNYNPKEFKATNIDNFNDEYQTYLQRKVVANKLRLYLADIKYNFNNGDVNSQYLFNISMKLKFDLSKIIQEMNLSEEREDSKTKSEKEKAEKLLSGVVNDLRTLAQQIPVKDNGFGSFLIHHRDGSMWHMNKSYYFKANGDKLTLVKASKDAGSIWGNLSKNQKRFDALIPLVETFDDLDNALRQTLDRDGNKEDFEFGYSSDKEKPSDYPVSIY